MKNLAAALALSMIALTAFAGSGTLYGKLAEEIEAVPLADVLEKPDSFVGQRIRIEGRITDVCPMRGCWLEIAGEEGDGTIRFKVKDGEIVFPTEAKGKSVVAEGTWKKIVMEGEKGVAYARHLADERGEEFDPSSVKLPLVMYQIDGTGARVH